MNSLTADKRLQIRLPQRIALSSAQALSLSSLTVDAVLIIATSIISGVVFHLTTRGIQGDVVAFLATGMITAVIFCGVLRIHGSQSKRTGFTGTDRVFGALIAWSMTFLFLIFLAFGLKVSVQFSRGTIFAFYLAGMLVVSVSRLLTPRLLAAWWFTNSYRGLEVLIVAPRIGLEGARLRATLSEQGCTSFRIIEFDDKIDIKTAWLAERRKLVQTVCDTALTAAQGEIYVIGGALKHSEANDLLASLRLIPRAIYFVPDHHTSTLLLHDVKRLGDLAAVEAQRSPLTKLELAIKRLLDIMTAGAGLALCAPLLTVIAVAIKLNSKGPVLFHQMRNGYRGRPFKILKFRSMTVQEDGDAIVQATRNDKRVTRVGAFLRKTSLDELPQLWNVVRGDMSVIGPRPHALAHDKLFGELIENYEIRQHVRPGITGWAQVNGLRGETPNIDLMYRRVEYDIWYATNCSFILDIKILIRTVIEVLRQRNAY